MGVHPHLGHRQMQKIPLEEFGQGTDFYHRLVFSRSPQANDFLQQAREFVVEFVKGFLRSTRRSLSFYKGLAAFDPAVLFQEDTEFGMSCFSCLFGELRKRGWFESTEKSTALSEYATFATEISLHHTDSSGNSLPVPNVIELFACHPLMSSRSLLSRAFRLVCLCLPSYAAAPDDPTLGLAAEDLPREAAQSIILPLYSYLSQTGPELSFSFGKDSVLQCRELINTGSATFSEAGFSPWDRVECNTREDIYPALLAAFKTACGSRSCSGPSSSSLVGVSGVPPLPAPSVPSAAARSSFHGKSFRKKSPVKRK